MASYRRENHTIAEFLEWHEKDQLVLQPKFQRRSVWSEPARSYLIDTIVRGLPMHKIFLRRTINPETTRMVYEVVDGQQRLNAVLDFYHGTLVLSQHDYPELGGVTFQGLPDPVRRAFLQYEVSTEVMEDALDAEVWAMFERLNLYAVVLSKQEKRNAKWFGEFKQTAYRLAAEQSALDAWRKLRVFTDKQIARMLEVEFTSDVIVAIVKGISDIAEIEKAYEDFDREFRKRQVAEKTFREALKFVTDELCSAVRTTRFHNRAWFYSLMVATTDALIGIPNGLGPEKLHSSSDVQRRMFELDHALRLLGARAGIVNQRKTVAPIGLNPLRDALSRGTSHAPPRITRHEHFFSMLTMSEKDWRERWRNLSGPG